MQQQILGLVNPTIALLFSCAFLLLWLQDRSAKNVAALVCGYLAMAAGYLAFHFTPAPNSVISVLVVHGFYSLSTTLLCWAIAQRVGAEVSVKLFLAIGALAGCGLIFSALLGDYPARLYATNTSYGIQFLLTTQALSRRVRTEAVDKVMLTLMILATAQFFVRPFTVLLADDNMSALEYRDSSFYALTMLTMVVVTMMIAMVQAAAIATDLMRSVRAEGDHDALTGVQSRRAFEEAAVELLEDAQERNIAVSVIVADIDHFKQVNDIWGHQVGDNALSVFGSLLQDSVRTTDPIGRVGGEEFCILVWDCGADAAERLAERIRVDFAACEVDGMRGDVALTASFGVAEWSEGEGYGKLFARADAALYEAKSGGRNRVVSQSDRTTRSTRDRRGNDRRQGEGQRAAG